MEDEIRAFSNYLKHEKRYSLHTVTAYERDLIDFALFVEQKSDIKKAADVHRASIRDWIVSLVDQQVQPSSVARKLSSLRSFFKYLQKKGSIEHNPVSGIKPPKKPQQVLRVLNESEMAAVLDQHFEENYTGQRNKMILHLLYACGLRRAELIGLRLQDVNFSQQLIRVTGKRNKQRELPLGKSLSAELSHFVQEWRAQVDCGLSNKLFLTEKGKSLYPELVYYLVNLYLSGHASVEKKSPHIVRHSMATHMLNNGADLHAIKEILGHSSLAATQIYTHNSIEKVKKMYNRAHPRGD